MSILGDFAIKTSRRFKDVGGQKLKKAKRKSKKLKSAAARERYMERAWRKSGKPSNWSW